jgi:hypothetical protein
MTTDLVPGPITPIFSSPPAAPPNDVRVAIRRWAGILLARNPFYIISAALLLWSMRRLSLDSRIFQGELPQILFNFSSFQFYELLLAGTAIVLARRRIWYDSGLLAGLENLFICVPFILISQALLLQNWIAFALCLACCGLALLRAGALKRWLTGLNMPASLLWPGALLLCFNLAWPLLIRLLHKDVSVPIWDGRGLTLMSLQWNWIIPAAVALGALLPVSPVVTAMTGNEEAPFFSWRSYPLLTLLMWIAGTCVHLCCIGYVYGLPWSAAWLAPAVWMAAWMLWWHRDNLAPENAGAALQRILLFPPVLIVLASSWTGRWTMCLVLSVLNALACGAIALIRRDRLARHLCTLSALLACVFMPHPAALLGGKIGNTDLVPAFLGGGLLYIIGWAVLSARPKLGIVGGICVTMGLARLLPFTATGLNLAVQAGLIFMLLHSFRWKTAGSSDAATARLLCGLYWLAHTIGWVAVEPSSAIHATLACGASVLGLYVCARILFGEWGPPMIAYSAVAVVCWGPLYLGGQNLLRAPDGLLTLLGSFALFGVGTLAAFLKARYACDSKSQARESR